MTSPSPASAPFLHVRHEEFAELEGAYLDAASMAPLPKRARVATEAFNRLRARIHTIRGEDFTRPVDEARAACARLIGADVSEIALGNNTSFGINIAALGLEVPQGSTVLVSDREFPANVYPWMNRARYTLERIPVDHRGWPDEERIHSRLRDPDVSVLALSSVQFGNGYRADLDALGHTCRGRGVLFVVDAIQSLGQIPLDVSRTPVDVVASGGHKWLCGPLGTGFLYVRRELQDRLFPTSIGWLSMEASQSLDSVVDYDWRFLPDARRYEQGTPPLQDLAAFAQSITLLLELGVERIQAYLADLLEPLRVWLRENSDVESLSSFDADRRSAIVSLRPPSLEPTFRSLRAAGVVCSIREGAIRIAPHFYNTASELEMVILVLEERRRGGWP